MRCATEMIKHILIAIMLLTLNLACAKNDRIIVESKDRLHPVLNMEVIDIPSSGKVYLVEGNAVIKKLTSAGYFDIVIDSLVENGDMLWIKAGSIVGIKFDDNTYILNEPQNGDKFITFDANGLQKRSK